MSVLQRRSVARHETAGTNLCGNGEIHGPYLMNACHTENGGEGPRPAAPDAANECATQLRVEGMDCPGEVAAIERVLKPLAGVREVRVNLMRSIVTVTHSRALRSDLLIKAIESAGFKTSLARAAPGAPTNFVRHPWIPSVALSGILTTAGMALESSSAVPPLAGIAAFVGAMAAGGWLILPKALRAARRLSPDMNLLMTVAVLGAIGLGKWSEGAAVVFLFALSELLESFSVARARRAVESLMELSPETAWRKEGETFREVPVEQVGAGDIVTVKSGARVPLDGEVTGGASAVNQAPITGESMPVEKKSGDPVFAGTINGHGSIEIRVTKAYSDTTLARIIRLIEEAQSQKAPSQRFVDVFAKYYTPAVMGLALLVWLVPPLVIGAAWAVWTYRALVLLVIACPCALVIATPVAVVSGLTALARRGVLIKGGAFLEAIGKLRALALDKTGTVTEGRPRVTRIVPFHARSPAECLRIAAAIDTHSDHPLARAVVACALKRGVEFPRGEDYRAFSGQGAAATVDGQRYVAGNLRFARERGVAAPCLEQAALELETAAQSVVVVGREPHAKSPGEVWGILAVADPVRPGVAQALQSLRAAGVNPIVMLSGDNQRTVDAIANPLGINEAQGDLLPDQKASRVRELIAEHRYVGMIGDGVNDAPAMATASVGIAMGAAGSDTAIETADMALMQDDLAKLAETVQVGRRTVGVIQANIAFAIGVKGIVLALALLGHASLWLAILADTGATLAVIANALRLLGAKRS